MKKLFVLFCLYGSLQFVSAQEIGARFGSSSGGDFAIDGVFGLGQFSRIHADVSFGDGGVGLDALWDFIYRPLGGEAFNWYVGAGPSMDIDNPFWLGASGEIGLEYRFKEVPIALGVDWRPTLWLVDKTKFSGDGFGINIRYCF